MTYSDQQAGPDAGPASLLGGIIDTAEVWLIRHGETAWSKSGQHTSRTDLDLTTHGAQQAEALRPLLSGLAPALVMCSPRHRSRRTARLAGVDVDNVDPDLSEWDYGDYEGLTTAQIRVGDPDWTIWADRVPGGENAAAVTARADRVIARAAGAVAEGPVLLFGHGHINRVIAARWLGLPAGAGGMFALGTAAPCLLGAEHHRPVIVRWNMTNPAVTRR